MCVWNESISTDASSQEGSISLGAESQSVDTPPHSAFQNLRTVRVELVRLKVFSCGVGQVHKQTRNNPNNWSLLSTQRYNIRSGAYTYIVVQQGT